MSLICWGCSESDDDALHSTRDDKRAHWANKRVMKARQGKYIFINTWREQESCDCDNNTADYNSVLISSPEGTNPLLLNAPWLSWPTRPCWIYLEYIGGACSPSPFTLDECSYSWGLLCGNVSIVGWNGTKLFQCKRSESILESTKGVQKSDLPVEHDWRS